MGLARHRGAALVLQLLLVTFALAVVPMLTSEVPYDVCVDDHTYYYDPAISGCVRCPENSVVAKTSAPGEFPCVCSKGFALHYTPESRVASCMDCASENMAVSSGAPFFEATEPFGGNWSQSCMPCGGDTRLPDLHLSDASFDAETAKCVCPDGFALTSYVGTVVLSAQMCTACGPDGAAGTCRVCEYPYMTAKARSIDECVCMEGFQTLSDRSCVPDTIYDRLRSIVSDVPLTAAIMEIEKAALCELGNTTACNGLANMCVVALYDQKSAACALYLHLVAKDGATPAGDGNGERPKTLPWLYYTASTADVFGDGEVISNVLAQQHLRFVVSSYTYNGTWLGYFLVVDQLNTCWLPNPIASVFYQAGDTRRVECTLDWRWLIVAPETTFYDLFLVDPHNASKLLPVPVLMDYYHTTFAPKTTHDSWLYRPGGSTTAPAVNGLRRRFYVYDNVAVGGVDRSDVQPPASVAVSHAITLLVSSNSRGGQKSTLQVPMFVLQYSTMSVSDLEAGFTEDMNVDSALIQQPLLSIGSKMKISKGNTSSDDAFALPMLVQTLYLPSDNALSTGMMIILIIVTCLCLVSAWVRTYGWMRRRQNLVLDVRAGFRFIVYLCDHISNCYFVVVALASWYVLIAYKSQYWLSVAIQEKDVYVCDMLYVAIVTKAVAVLYGLVEQCNASYFIIDWERSKGQLLRENKMVPVSMWRSAFLANELNELQMLRHWHPLFTITIILLFLVGLGYLNLSLSIPLGTVRADPTAVVFDTLRIAVDTFFWCAVSLVIYLLEYHIYYRLVVDPVEVFIDFCSVSNLSVMVLLEPQWGFYIHGQSIHAHADVSMEEYQQYLELESQGNLPVRGLGGQSKCQTFEVFLGPYTHEYLLLCYAEMQMEQQRADVAAALAKAKEKPGHSSQAAAKARRLKNMKTTSHAQRWHYLDFLFGKFAKQHSPAVIAIKDRINRAFQLCVQKAETTLMVKFPLQHMIDFPPNIMYMNGPQSGDYGSKDIFFMDDKISLDRVLMCGLDKNLFILYAALFAAIDASLHNVYAAAVLTFVVEIVFSYYRRNEGVANLSRKTLLDKRFFL